jgi:hypothetical protein
MSLQSERIQLLMQQSPPFWCVIPDSRRGGRKSKEHSRAQWQERRIAAAH